MRTILATAICLIAATGAAQANTNLVTNGDFASTTLTGTGTKAQITNSTTVTDWSVSNSNKLIFIDTPGSADNGTYLSVWAGFPNQDTASGAGGNFIESDGDPNYSTTFYQSVSGLTVGQSYLLTFDFAGSEQTGFTSPTGYTTEWWNVSLDTSVLTSAPSGYTTSQANLQKTAMLTTPNQGYSAWQTASMYFTATATTEYLNFLAGGTPTGKPPIAFLDNVNLQVPEPGSLALLGAGLAGLVMVARRRTQPGAAAA